MNRSTSFFNYGLSVGARVDIGKERSSNQDEVIVCPEVGFYAVSDGMGGFTDGGKASRIIKKSLPGRMKTASKTLMKNPSPKRAARLLKEKVYEINDMVFFSGLLNSQPSEERFGSSVVGGNQESGATLSGVWLTGGHAVFVNLGDSRGYLLPRNRKKISQVTDDHNVAAELVKNGDLTKKAARSHPTSCMLTRFVGNFPAEPDIFIRKVSPGDKILLCSDGLYGMVNEELLPAIMRSSENPEHVCEQLVEEANTNGGRDNISVVCIDVK